MFEPTPADLRIATRRERAFVLIAQCYLTRDRAQRTRRRAQWLVPKARFVLKRIQAQRAAVHH